MWVVGHIYTKAPGPRAARPRAPRPKALDSKAAGSKGLEPKALTGRTTDACEFRLGRGQRNSRLGTTPAFDDVRPQTGHTT